ncbi:hypothetical protein, partial [Candidatus Binatus sp.]|uniref:hypothetical protein n=1 Tax=Candidatus Binatus sp. TaxID=2811406 RepID=UPI002FDAF96C
MRAILSSAFIARPAPSAPNISISALTGGTAPLVFAGFWLNIDRPVTLNPLRVENTGSSPVQ